MPSVVFYVVTKHARDRMAQRLGRDATRAEWLDILSAILTRHDPGTTPRAILLEERLPAPGRDRSQVFAVSLGDLAFRVVWLPDFSRLITVIDGTNGGTPPHHHYRPKRPPRHPPGPWRQELLASFGGGQDDDP